MKKLSFIIGLLLLNITAFAQNVDLRRKIEVSGTAQKEITPDIINVSISLKEYLDGKNKVTISQLEGQLERAITEAGIAKADFTINNLSSYNYVDPKKKTPDFLASKQYLIRFHDLNKYNQILSKIDPKGIQSTSINSYDYSKMSELKRDLKIQALLAAKEKATYLLNAVGEKLGSVLDITENDDSGYQAPAMYNRVVMAKAEPAESDIDIKKIKLNFQVHAVFEIAK